MESASVWLKERLGPVALHGEDGPTISATPASRDCVHYRDRGWLESDYYTPVELGAFKRALGALFDWFFARDYGRPAPVPRLDEPASGRHRSASEAPARVRAG